jgi:hypothetical protein
VRYFHLKYLNFSLRTLPFNVVYKIFMWLLFHSCHVQLNFNYSLFNCLQHISLRVYVYIIHVAVSHMLVFETCTINTRYSEVFVYVVHVQ